MPRASDNGRALSPKLLALATLARALEETERPDAALAVLRALLQGVQARIVEIEELRRPRRKPKDAQLGSQ